MKRKLTVLSLAMLMLNFSCKEEKNEVAEIIDDKVSATDAGLQKNSGLFKVKVIPINHGTLVLETTEDVIYVDPVGGSEAFAGQKNPTIVLITDIHGDHLNIKTLESLDLSTATLIAPKAVTEKLPQTLAKIVVTLNNGDVFGPAGKTIEAIPMYNLREEAKNFHTKGRGNGYVLTLGEERIYISGDTEDIPEMRSLKDIDKAFICMNLPYTMTVESAASAVIDFKPKEVYPYHYRGTNGFSDVEAFKSLVNKGAPSTKVVHLVWYN